MAKAATTTNTIKGNTMTGVGNLIRLLPTGTVFLFQFLKPVFTNNGNCSPLNKHLTSALVCLSGLSCFLSTFTDSYKDFNGNTHYGLVTLKGLWPSTGSTDTSAYKLRFRDFVHAFFALGVFAVVSLLDSKTMNCFYPKFDQEDEKMLLMALPTAIGAVSSAMFVIFPNRRHGIGYPSS